MYTNLERNYLYSHKSKNKGSLIVVNTMGIMKTILYKEGDRRQKFSSFQIKPFYKETEANYDQIKSMEGPESPIYETFIT